MTTKRSTGMRLGFLFALVGFAPLPAAPCDAAPADAAVRASIVTVSARLGVHRDAIGAGVVVATTPYGLRIITARHVVRSGELTVWIDRRPFPAEIVRTFSGRDVAVLDSLVPPDVRERARIADTGPQADDGDALTVWGENDEGPHVQQARIIATHWSDPNDSARPPLLRIACARCEPGDSGGGVFSSHGTLVGILTARYRTTSGTIVAVVAEPVDRSLYALGEP